jgi:hypothetical protein
MYETHYQLPRFSRRGQKDLLADTVESLVGARSPDSFYFVLSGMQRGGNGKEYKNFDRNLPPGGDYQELEVNGPGDSRRIVVDMRTFDVFPTRDHYRTMTHAGRPGFANN